MANIQEVETMVTEILTARSAEHAALRSLLAADEQTISEAEEAMSNAKAAGNVEAYETAKNERSGAIDAKEIHVAQIEMLRNQPLISKADYEKAVSDIYAEVAALENETEKQLALLSDQMNSAANTLIETMNHANEVLSRLQHEVYRDADPEKKEVGHKSIADWGKAGINHPQYKAYASRAAE